MHSAPARKTTQHSLLAVFNGCCVLRRIASVIENEAVLKIADEFEAHGLFEHVARARKQATGAMFPSHVA